MRVTFVILILAIMSATLLATGKETSNLPKPVTDYFSAIANNDRKLLSDLYVEKATILEVNRTISGHKSILYWADNEVFGGKYKILRVISSSPIQTELIVEFIPRGASTGFRANYKFQMTGTKINHMNLQYAD